MANGFLESLFGTATRTQEKVFLSEFERARKAQAERQKKLFESKDDPIVPGITQSDFQSAGFNVDPNVPLTAPARRSQLDDLSTEAKTQVQAFAGSRQATGQRVNILADEKDTATATPESGPVTDSTLQFAEETISTASPQSPAKLFDPADFALLSPSTQEALLLPLTSANQRGQVFKQISDRIKSLKLNASQAKQAAEAVKNTQMLELASSVWKKNGFQDPKLGTLGAAMRVAIDVGLTEGIGLIPQNLMPQFSEYFAVQGLVAEQMLRAATGAATNPSEVKKYRGLLPLPGDNPGVVDNKLRALAVLMVNQSNQKEAELRGSGRPSDILLADKLRNNREKEFINMFNRMRMNFTTAKKGFGEDLSDVINLEAESNAATVGGQAPPDASGLSDDDIDKLLVIPGGKK